MQNAVLSMVANWSFYAYNSLFMVDFFQMIEDLPKCLNKIALWYNSTCYSRFGTKWNLHNA